MSGTASILEHAPFDAILVAAAPERPGAVSRAARRGRTAWPVRLELDEEEEPEVVPQHRVDGVVVEEVAEVVEDVPLDTENVVIVVGDGSDGLLVTLKRQRLDHPRDERRLRRHLPVRDWDRRNDVRAVRVLLGNELRAGHGEDRHQHSLAPDSRRARRYDQRVHAASMRPLGPAA